jgi:hypothetical protein
LAQQFQSREHTNNWWQATGKLEYHIPRQYDAKRPGFLWSHELLEQRIGDHPLASRMPTPESSLKRPTLFPGSEDFHELVTAPGHATKISNWTETDLPALSVHVVSFADATLLTLSWSHVFLDAIGRQSLLKAWISVLKGQEDDIPPFVPFNVDPAGSIAQGGEPSSHVLYKYALSGFWFALFVIGYVYELVVHSAESSQMICCPGPWVENLRQQAIADAITGGHGEKDLFLSHGDVLLAWWTKVLTKAQNLSSSQPINIMNVANLRGLLPDQLPENTEAVYISNAAISAYTLTTSRELASTSVGELALRLRRDLQEQRTPEQARHFVAWQHESVKKNGRSPLIGIWNQINVGFSNWHRARFFDMDFSGAVLQPGTPLATRSNKLGQPSLILTNGHTDGFSTRNIGPLMGRDAAGNWWIQCALRTSAWTSVEKQLEKL